MIKFSVIVPVYNAGSYLQNCIESVLNQSYSNYELILVDDGSTDGSEDICDNYAKNYLQICVYHKENRGQLHSREFGIRKALGDYYVFLDADDALTSDALEIIQTKIQKYQCDCVSFRCVRVWNNKVVNTIQPMQEEFITDKRMLYKKCLLSNEYNSISLKAVKASIFVNYKEDYSDSYHIRIGEDLLQSLEVFKNCNGIVFIGDVLYRYTLNPNSITHTLDLINDTGSIAVREKVLVFLKEEDVFTEQDFKDYHSSCVLIYVKELISVCCLRATVSRKIAVLNKMRNTDYYSKYICGEQYDKSLLGKKKIVFELHKHGFDRLTVCVVSIYRFLIKLVRPQ